MIRRFVLWFHPRREVIGWSVVWGSVGCGVVMLFGVLLATGIYHTNDPTTQQCLTSVIGLTAGLGVLVGLWWVVTRGYSRLVHWAELPARVAEDLEGTPR